VKARRRRRWIDKRRARFTRRQLFEMLAPNQLSEKNLVAVVKIIHTIYISRAPQKSIISFPFIPAFVRTQHRGFK